MQFYSSLINFMLTNQIKQENLLTEEEKIIMAAKSDRKFFQPLYDRYYASILRFVYSRMENLADAQDITQQAFLQAMVALEKFEFRGVPFSSWLYKIALNEVNQYYRKTKASFFVEINENGLNELIEETEKLDQEEAEIKLMNAMKQLNPDEIELIRLRYFDKKSFKEIAEILSMNDAAAKMRIYRILEKIKQHFNNL